jgi:hypothetical protein
VVAAVISRSSSHSVGLVFGVRCNFFIALNFVFSRRLSSMIVCSILRTGTYLGEMRYIHSARVV